MVDVSMIIGRCSKCCDWIRFWRDDGGEEVARSWAAATSGSFCPVDGLDHVVVDVEEVF